MIFYYLAGAFKLWMLIDCARRRGATHWYFIILIPLGAWAYFFMVKIHDYDLAWLDLAATHQALGHAGRATEVLTDLVRTSPVMRHQLALARHLTDSDRRGEARSVLDEALESYEHSPAFIQRRDRRVARAAEALRRSLTD